MLTFRYLPAFLAVSETGSFTAAGRSLHIATSAVSRQIRLLEEECGGELFRRLPREACLTDLGRELYDEVKAFRAGTERILGEISPQCLRIGVLEGVLQNWLVDLVARPHFPRDVNLDLRVGHPGELVAAVEEGKLDATFFSYVHRTRLPAGVRAIRLFREEIVLISRQKVSSRELESHPWICYTNETYLVRARKRLPPHYVVVNHMGSVVELVRRGRGIAMVPSHVIRDRRRLHVQPVPRFSNEFVSLVLRRGVRESEALGGFLSFLKEHSPEWKELRTSF